ncbi:MAG: hypothetical protein DRI57_21705 [Deltaproteobacteria bacterium]|nr:MAG: hypothetical protein DRI57_21705 [Deltaproteobacteria bacterium]
MTFSVSDLVCPGEKESNAKIIATKHILFNVMIASSLLSAVKNKASEWTVFTYLSYFHPDVKNFAATCNLGPDVLILKKNFFPLDSVPKRLYYVSINRA